MKNISMKIKILLLLIVAFIIAGVVTLFVNGFEKSLAYSSGTRIEVYIPDGYVNEDIINLAKESFKGKEFIFEEIEKLNQVASIKIKTYTEEELSNFKSKISEKYDIKEENLELHEIPLPETQINTVLEPYIFPVVLVTVLALIYVLFKNLKCENKWNIVLKTLTLLILTIGTYFSIILVFKLSFGIYTMPLALVIYLITLLISVNNKK